jgi:uncharacterized membrane protein
LESSSDYLAGGAIALVFGLVAILLRKHSIRTSRGSRAFAEKIGVRLPSERLHEALQTILGPLFILVGVGFTIAALVMLSQG